jgi:hypothetical protein
MRSNLNVGWKHTNSTSVSMDATVYDEISGAPDWPDLSPEARAERLLARYEQWYADADKPKADYFQGTREEKLEHMERVILYFENQR